MRSLLLPAWLRPRASFLALIAVTLAVSAPAFAQSPVFGGSTEIRIPHAPVLNPSSVLTLEAWVKPTSHAACQTIVTKSAGAWWLGLCGGRVSFISNGLISLVQGPSVAPIGEWTHVAVTFDGTTRTYYLNGQVDLVAAAGEVLGGNASDLLIAHDPTAVLFNGWQGELADVRIWNVMRTQADIRNALYDEPPAGTPGLTARWPLQGSAEEVGVHDPVPPVLVSFTGSPSPAAATRLPRLVDPISVDGFCALGAAQEYDLALPLPLLYSGSDFGTRVRIGASDTDLHVCFNNVLLGANTGQHAGVYLDPFGNGGDRPQNDDWRVLASWFNQTAFEQAGGLITLPGGSGWGRFVFVDLDFNADPGPWLPSSFADAEFRISREALPDPTRFRLQFLHQDISGPLDDAGIPDGTFDREMPWRWPFYWIDDAGPAPLPDGAPPTASVVVSTLSPAPDQLVTLSASGRDDVDLDIIDVYVDDVLVRRCVFSGIETGTRPCIASDVFGPGAHEYWAEAIDHRGRVGRTPRGRFFGFTDSDGPRVRTEISPPDPDPGDLIRLRITAEDDAGVESIVVFTDLPQPASQCNFGGGQLEATCELVVSAPTRSMFRFGGRATDNTGNRTNAGPRWVVLGPHTPDADGDGLSDAVEALLCTSASNPDTDGDTLLDGWEVRGLRFDDGVFIDLPDMGANECRRDIMLQLDYEAGNRPTDGELQAMINAYDVHGVGVRLTDLNERPAPVDDESTLTATSAPALQDAQGNYWVEPRRWWTHLYLFARQKSGRSAAWWRFGNIDMLAGSAADSTLGRRGDVAYRLIHELGHIAGLGHGGRSGPRVQNVVVLDQDEGAGLRQRPYIYYGTAKVNENRKPNYHSIMNYGYNGNALCYDPGTGDLSQSLGFTDVVAPQLFETSLDETFDSTYADWLRTRTWCDPGWFPAARYRCTDPDELDPADVPYRYVMITDGIETLLRRRFGGSVESTNLPGHAPGIDWNCDGTIESSVQADVNDLDGDQDDYTVDDDDVLVGWSDEAAMAAGHPCHIYWSENSGYSFPLAYREDILGVDCNTSEAAAGSFGALAAAAAPAGPFPDLEPLEEPENPFDEFLEQLPGYELCDGENNDGDDEIDEGCRDSDQDGLADVLDNCPQTANALQIDRDGDRVGDACEPGAIDGLTVSRDVSGAGVLTWQTEPQDLLGFSVWRYDSVAGDPVYIGSEWPTTSGQGFVDPAAPLGAVTYLVRAIGRGGQPSDEVASIVLDPNATDTDGDGFADVFDNCPFTPNDQTSSDGGPIGDACRCGDVDTDGRLLLADVQALRATLAGTGSLSPDGFARCRVVPTSPDCDIVQAVALRRWVEAAASPGPQQVCPPALP